MVYLNICVTVGSVQHESCDNSSLPGGQSNFSYCKWCHWSSSALVNLISIDQSLIFDNFASENIIRVVLHRKHLEFNLQIDTLPCETTEDDIPAALMQLLPYGYVYHMFTSLV